MAILFSQNRNPGRGGAVREQRLVKPAKLSKVQPEAMLQGSLKACCPGRYKRPKRPCTGTDARQSHNSQPKNPRAASVSGQDGVGS